MLRRNFRRASCLALAGVLSVLAATPASAHSFKVDIVFPQSASVAARDDFLREFHRASAERDGHADEESNGHLGGLDVYTNATELSGSDDSLTGVFVVMVGEGTCQLAAAASPSGIVIDAARFATVAGATIYKAAYQRRYGGLPADAALAGYLVARHIDAIVRPLGGVDDVAALREGLQVLCD